MEQILCCLFIYVFADKLYDIFTYVTHKFVRKDTEVNLREFSIFRRCLVKILRIPLSDKGIRYPKLHEELIRMFRKLFK